jgi:hypothetical protein
MGQQSLPKTFRVFDVTDEHAGPVSNRPERLVGFGFRRALKAIETGDQMPWEFAWQEFANATDPDRATQLVARLSVWARAVRRCSGRRIETLPSSCPGFCRDECLAISMIAASQHQVCPALRACAFALMGASEISPALEASDAFGAALTRSGQILSPLSVCNALAFSEPANQKPS